MERSDTVKAILIIEMPSSCSECNLQQYGICHAVRKCITGTPKELKSKPDWCPLKPMPDKKNRNNRVVGDYLRGRSDGYNACIDEILGDKG